MLQNSHEAGVGGLEGEILNGFVSFIKSIYECQKKRKEPKEALKRTTTETLKGGAYIVMVLHLWVHCWGA